MFEAEIKTLGSKVDIATWLYEGGLPADAATATSAKAATIEKLASGGDIDPSGWTTTDWTIYLRSLADNVPQARLQALDDRYKLTATTNPEIAMHWLPRAVRADMRAAAPAVEAYLMKVGRVRNLRPLYKEMMAGGEFWRALAKTTFERAQPKYHPITRSAMAEIVNASR
jgi:hypothetical protein